MPNGEREASGSPETVVVLVELVNLLEKRNVQWTQAINLLLIRGKLTADDRRMLEALREDMVHVRGSFEAMRPRKEDPTDARKEGGA